MSDYESEAADAAGSLDGLDSSTRDSDYESEAYGVTGTVQDTGMRDPEELMTGLNPFNDPYGPYGQYGQGVMSYEDALVQESLAYEALGYVSEIFGLLGGFLGWAVASVFRSFADKYAPDPGTIEYQTRTQDLDNVESMGDGMMGRDGDGTDALSQGIQDVLNYAQNQRRRAEVGTLNGIIQAQTTNNRVQVDLPVWAQPIARRDTDRPERQPVTTAPYSIFNFPPDKGVDMYSQPKTSIWFT